MEIYFEILKILFLFISILYGSSYTGQMIKSHTVGSNIMFLMSFGLTGFIYMQWLM